jgi:hypothetical protein
MKEVAPEERAALIHDFLLKEALAEVEGLLKLLAATGDANAVRYMADVFDSADAIARRNIVVNLRSDPAEREDLLANHRTFNRVAAVHSVAMRPGNEASAFLNRAALVADHVAQQATKDVLAARLR